MLLGYLKLLNIRVGINNVRIASPEFKFGFRVSKSSANLEVKKEDLQIACLAEL